MSCVAYHATNRPIVIGAGAAGLMTALYLAPEPALVLAKAPLGCMTTTGWALGGIAAALGSGDKAALHAADTLVAGDGLCDPRIVARIAEAARDAVRALVRHGVVFDKGEGEFELGLKAAHGRRRLLHAAAIGPGKKSCAL